MVRGQLVLAGLAVAMFFTPTAHSQEITNSTFDDSTNVAGFAQSSAAQPSAQQIPVATAAPTVNEMTSIQGSLAPSNAALIDSPWVAAGLTVLLLSCVALSAISESKRRRNSYAVRRQPSYRNA